MSYINVILHAVWGTKNRHPFLTKQIRREVFQHIAKYANEKGIKVDRINGYHNHVHCLFRLDSKLTISKVLQFLKGESSYWINQNKLTPNKFEWADEYYVGSVNPYDLIKIRSYIDNQEKHHNKKTFDEEWESLMNNDPLT
ncbi:MAG: IS200/IS605 family transposase [Saprospiraceae bacterium]|nr:IS200/IS605 family transposase [Saprospiraceae bacterium]MBK9629569.1 IS200/IS605 family transposase [Saprospiraceae bacterium]